MLSMFVKLKECEVKLQGCEFICFRHRLFVAGAQCMVSFPTSRDGPVHTCMHACMHPPLTHLLDDGDPKREDW
jgi:hypothetical protein